MKRRLARVCFEYEFCVLFEIEIWTVRNYLCVHEITVVIFLNLHVIFQRFFISLQSTNKVVIFDKKYDNKYLLTNRGAADIRRVVSEFFTFKGAKIQINLAAKRFALTLAAPELLFLACAKGRPNILLRTSCTLSTRTLLSRRRLVTFIISLLTKHKIEPGHYSDVK